VTFIRVEKNDGIGVITIDRKERFNSLDVQTARDLRKAGLSLARDEEVRAVILRGIPNVFCSGADLKYIRAGGADCDLSYLKSKLPSCQVAGLPSQERQAREEKDLDYLKPRLPGFQVAALPEEAQRQPGNPVTRQPDRQPGNPATRQPPTGHRAPGTGHQSPYGEIFKQILEYIHSTISEIRRAPKPFIASVDGIAAAGGFGLAMSCDLVIASERATFEWAYSKTGLTGAESSTFFLPRLLGFRRAMELLFLNPRLDAKAALDYGLVTRVLPVEGFDEAVLAIAKQAASGPTEALGIAKNLINDAATMDRLDYHLDRELDNLARIADGANFAEGIDAFFGKREPVFGTK
jgi:2-(1,2-epoxy-1,2-dihydrophenyl)acetyl-CoA isomerase